MLGLGTYRLTNSETLDIVYKALEHQICIIDTAQLYGNESAVGAAISKHILDTDTSFDEFIGTHIIITKIGLNQLNQSDVKELAIKSIMESQANCVLIHAPVKNYLAVWHELCMLHRSGLIPYIGVSNFGIQELENIRKNSEIMPYFNQVEITPFNQCLNLRKYCNTNGIKILTHSCLTKGRKLNHTLIRGLADKYKCTPAKILIGWAMAHKMIPLFSTTNTDHLLQNLQNICIEPSDIDLLDTLESKYMTHAQYKNIQDTF